MNWYVLPVLWRLLFERLTGFELRTSKPTTATLQLATSHVGCSWPPEAAIIFRQFFHILSWHLPWWLPKILNAPSELTAPPGPLALEEPCRDLGTMTRSVYAVLILRLNKSDMAERLTHLVLHPILLDIVSTPSSSSELSWFVQTLFCSKPKTELKIGDGNVEVTFLTVVSVLLLI